MPKKSLFSGSGASGQTLLKEDNANQAKKEISNSISNAKASNMNTSMNNSDFMKKTDKKPDTLKEIIIEDDTDDWSAVPAFLRRKK